MYEYLIENRFTEERNVVYGYNEEDAFRRAKLVRAEWWVWNVEYVD